MSVAPALSGGQQSAGVLPLREPTCQIDDLGEWRHATMAVRPLNDPVRHARFRRVTVGLWMLDAATPTGRWQSTMLRGPLPELLDALVNEFPWLLAQIV